MPRARASELLNGIRQRMRFLRAHLGDNTLPLLCRRPLTRPRAIGRDGPLITNDGLRNR